MTIFLKMSKIFHPFINVVVDLYFRLRIQKFNIEERIFIASTIFHDIITRIIIIKYSETFFSCYYRFQQSMIWTWLWSKMKGMHLTKHPMTQGENIVQSYIIFKYFSKYIAQEIL